MTLGKRTIAVLIVLVGAAQAAAQTTQPSPPSWDEAVGGVAAALASQPGAAPLETLISPRLWIHPFNSAERSAPQQLLQYCSNVTLISARAYAWPSETIATDLGADISACELMPQAMRRQYAPRDDADARRSNQIAKQWIGSVLQPTSDSFIAVLVLWEPPPMVSQTFMIGSAPTTEPNPPVIVLLRGEKDESGNVRITRIAYGNVKEALN